MPRKLRHLPGREPGEDTLRERVAFSTQPLDLLADVQLRVVADELKLVDLRLELSNGLLEIQELQIHAGRNSK